MKKLILEKNFFLNLIMEFILVILQRGITCLILATDKSLKERKKKEAIPMKTI